MVLLGKNYLGGLKYADFGSQDCSAEPSKTKE